MIEFDGTGPLAAALRASGRNPRPRAAQREYVEQVRNIFGSGAPGFIDAATGVGKTLGYLIPAIEASETDVETDAPLVVISTATIALQKQILQDDIPVAIDAAQRAGMDRPGFAMRVGRGQLVSITALKKAIEAHATDEEMSLAKGVMKWSANEYMSGRGAFCRDLIDRFAPPEGPLVWMLPAVISSSAAESDLVSDTYYETMCENGRNADILVVNHHLLALHLIRPFLWPEDRSVTLIIDEADRFPRIVEEIRRSQVSLLHFRNRLRRTSMPGAAEAGDLVKLLSEVDAAPMGMERFSRLDDKVTHEARDLIEKICEKTAKGLKSKKRDRCEEIAEIEKDLDDLGQIIQQIRIDRGMRVSVSWSPVRKFPSLIFGDARDAMIIGRRLGPDSDDPVAERVLFTSATLAGMASRHSSSPLNAMSDFVRDCGFRRSSIPTENFATIEPARFGEMEFIRPPIGSPFPFLRVEVSEDEEEDERMELDPEAIDLWRRMILSAADTPGRVLVLAPAIRDVRAIAEACEELGDRLIVQDGTLGTSAAIRAFLERPDSVWISASVWEGLSLPGAIRKIVIPRIPIPPRDPGTAIFEAFIADLTGSESRGRSAAMNRQLAAARRRLRQGIGRGIRSDEDNVTIWIGDGRWPLTQDEIDHDFSSQPKPWSVSMLNAIPSRFRKSYKDAPRFDDQR